MAPPTNELNSDNSAAITTASQGLSTDAIGTMCSVNHMIAPLAKKTSKKSTAGPTHDISRTITGHNTALSTPKTRATTSADGKVDSRGIPMLIESREIPSNTASSTRIATAEESHNTTNSMSSRTTLVVVRIAPLSLISGIVV